MMKLGQLFQTDVIFQFRVLRRRDFCRVVCAVAAVFFVATFQAATSSSATDNTLLLAIDDHLLPLRHCLCYYISKPEVRTEPVLFPRSDDPQASDRGGAFFYGTVLHDAGKFRMWYYAKSAEIKYGNPGYDRQSHVAYAESDDGIHWTRPNLGQVEFEGSRDNNLIALPGAKQYGACVIKEDDDPDPQRRYKMVFNSRYTGERAAQLDVDKLTKRELSAAGGRRFRTATSPDGIHWTASPVPPVGYFIEIGSFFKHDGLYIVHAHGVAAGAGEGGSPVGRQGFACVSPDFDNWVEGYAEAFMLPEPRDPAKRGGQNQYDQVHIGVGGASLGNVAVGLLGLWHERGWGTGGTDCDFGLLVSNDGIHFREPVKGHVLLRSEESPVTPVEGKDYPTILCQYNGILNIGDETRIYHGRWRNDERLYGEVALATLPRDRWGALGLYPDEPEGWVWSAPFLLPEGGCRLSLNADEPQLMRVELSDERFRMLPQFSGEDSGVAQASEGLEAAVRWPRENFGDLGGTRVRFRIHLKRQVDREPRFYGAYLKR